MISAGVIGWPVAHSKSPLIHRFWLAKLGLDGDYGRFPVHPDGLGDAIRALPALGLRGVNVTVPHKVAVMAYLDRIDAVAAKVGAVNTVVVEDGKLVGYNTDVGGVREALAGDDDWTEATIVIVGAGGAARAAFAAFEGVEGVQVMVFARNHEQSAALVALPIDVVTNISPFSDLGGVIEFADVLINASPLGMTGRPDFDPWVYEAIARCDVLTVFDMVYAPLETPLLAAARARGLRTIDGLAMLIGQAAAAFELFFGAPAPREHDAELRARLTA
jgi:shikimate dehydrogenase